jgi:TM2 domain-containing membrane protein YozV
MVQQDHNTLNTEIILSLIGIFGIGWLMAGETGAGVFLLIGSILIYWPMMFLGTFLTDGLALFCLAPLAIGAIILNAVLLNSKLKRSIMAPPQRRMPLPPNFQ